MDRIDLTSPTQLSALLKRHGFHTRKRFGQNFLVDRNIVNKILDAAEITEGDLVLEVGPGVGTLTTAAAERGARTTAVEIDARAIEILSEVLEGLNNVEIVQADFLSLDLPSFMMTHFGDAKVKVLGNLPYYITTPIISRLFEIDSRIDRIVLMVQKEVAERLQSPPGTKDYGSMSVFVQYHAVPKIVARVPNTVFFPPPEVSSAIIRLTPRSEPPVDVPSEEALLSVVHCAFGKRRKTLLNSLSDCPSLGLEKTQISHILHQADIDPSRRAETLSLEEFARITRIVDAGQDGPETAD